VEKYLKTDRSGVSKIKRWAVGLMSRKFQCYSIGAEKTGTTTIHSMLKDHYRSGHEVDPKQTMQLVIDYQKEEISRAFVANILKKRD
jgi:hypothetical protein